jgi:hypothetical protein
VFVVFLSPSEKFGMHFEIFHDPLFPHPSLPIFYDYLPVSFHARYVSTAFQRASLNKLRLSR